MVNGKDRIVLRAGDMDKEVQKNIRVTYKGTDITTAVSGIEVIPSQLIKLLEKQSKDNIEVKIVSEEGDMNMSMDWKSLYDQAIRFIGSQGLLADYLSDEEY